MCNQGRIDSVNTFSFECEYMMNIVEYINEIAASNLHCNTGFDLV
jgi:hypothetical protein